MRCDIFNVEVLDERSNSAAGYQGHLLRRIQNALILKISDILSGNDASGIAGETGEYARGSVSCRGTLHFSPAGARESRSGKAAATLRKEVEMCAR
jgi:hypothetical protein